MKATQQAKQHLNELIEAARTGQIIPVRLTGQLEALAALLEQAEAEHAEAETARQAANVGASGDAMHDNAEFLKTTIHELRTPMTSIRGYSDMLSNPGMVGELTEMQDQLLQVVRSNARRMEGLLSDMSYINKIRAGIVNLNNKMDMYKNIVGMVENQARPIAQSLNRQLTFNTPDGMPILTTDGELFALAMVKLIENGLRYSDEETGKVEVAAQGDGSTLIITIADNGIGMSADELTQLGTLFYRADNDTVRNHKGSGLGVFIAYELLKLLGGQVSVSSTPGHGTTFTLRFKGMA